LNKLVKRRYPLHSFDEQVALELFEQNDKGFDNAVKISSYAMTVVTAFQILVERIVQESRNLTTYLDDISEGGESETNQLNIATILRESKKDIETLLMAFGEKNT
jgi:hypothetical protein